MLAPWLVTADQQLPSIGSPGTPSVPPPGSAGLPVKPPQTDAVQGGKTLGDMMTGTPAAGKPVPLKSGPNGTYTSPDPSWAHLIERESSGDPKVTQHGYTDINTGGNEAQGLFQITPKNWNEMGADRYAPSPGQASPLQQAEVAGQLFRNNPSGSDWGAGLPGRESPGGLMKGLGG